MIIKSPARKVDEKSAPATIAPVMPNPLRPDVRPTYFSPSMRSPVFSSTAARPGAISIEAQYANQVPLERQGAVSLTDNELVYATTDYGLRGALPLSYGARERVPSRLRQARGVGSEETPDMSRLAVVAGIGAVLIVGGLLLCKKGSR